MAIQELKDVLPAITGNQKPVELQQRKTFDERLRTLQSVAESDAERYAQVLKIILWVENVKQIHLSEEEQRALAIALTRLPESVENILKRAKAVARNTDYARIPLDVWLHSQTLYTEGELNLLVNQRIATRRKQWEALQQDKTREELDRLAEEQGFIEASTLWNRELQNAIEKQTRKLVEKYRKLKVQFHLLPDKAKRELWGEAFQLGVIKGKDDPFWHLILPYLIPKMPNQFEEKIKSHSIKR